MILFKMIRLGKPYEDVLARNLRCKGNEFSIDIFDITSLKREELDLAIHSFTYGGAKFDLTIQEAGFVEL